MSAEAKVEISCRCGQSYSVPRDALGKTIKCRVCRQEFVCVLERADRRSTKACASCGERIPAEKIICTICGYNHRTKKKAKRSDANVLAERSKARERHRENRENQAVKKPKKHKKAKRAEWGIDAVAISSGAIMLVLGLLIIGVGILAGRIMIWGGVLAFLGALGLLKGLVGKEGVW